MAQQTAIIQMFASLQHLLPCDICKEHYTQDFALHGGVELQQAAASGRSAMMQWCLDLHNRVSALLSKPKLTFDTLEAYLGANVSTQMCGCIPSTKRAWLPGDAYTWSIIVLAVFAAGLLVAVSVLGARSRIRVRKY